MITTTISGRQVDLWNPQPNTIHLFDIVTALPRLNRYLGHTRTERGLTVAQHSVMVANRLPDQLKLQGLLHDAPEAYMGDIIRPVREFFRDEAQAIEDRLYAAIAERFGLPTALDPLVRVVDNELLRVERECFVLGAGEQFRIWTEDEARSIYFHSLRSRLPPIYTAFDPSALRAEVLP